MVMLSGNDRISDAVDSVGGIYHYDGEWVVRQSRTLWWYYHR